MTFWYIFTLALIQGITEFLPISSSAHLALAPKFLHEADQGLLMDMALHLGTLSAILVYYRKDVLDMILSVVQWKNPARDESRRLAIYIALATIPALAVGLIIHKIFPEGIRDVRVIMVTTIVFGMLMGFADRFGKSEKTVGDIKLKQAMIIGFAQAMSLIPGTSRSGITMTTARFLGFKRVDCARFSFLLGIPATAAACLMGVVDILKSDDPGLISHASTAAFLCFIVGLCAIHFMMKYLTKFGLWPFVVYRLALGAVLLIWFV